MSQIKAFYFPSSVVMLDDDDAFLTNMSLRISDLFEVKTFIEPSLAVSYVKNNYTNNVLADVQSVVKREDKEENDFSSLIVDFDHLSRIHNNHDRDKVCSAIIVDFSMPGMDGITFCQKISDIPVPKIMLTGHGTFHLAVDAFNKGLINQFIVKDGPNMYEKLIQAIRNCQNQFFNAKSYPIINAIQLADNNIMNSSNYIDCLHHVLEENKIKEYYLLDDRGTYLFLDGNGKKVYFQTIKENDFMQYLNILENSSGSESLISRVRSRLMSPFFLSEKELQLPVCEWENILQPVTKFNDIYYMLREGKRPCHK